MMDSLKIQDSPHVLVVDDDVNLRKILRTGLTFRGISVCEADNGQEALRVLENDSVDFVLLDWYMPVMDGLETCLAIRTASRIPILAMSNIDRSEQALAAGASGFLLKPCDIEDLITRIQTMLPG